MTRTMFILASAFAAGAQGSIVIDTFDEGTGDYAGGMRTIDAVLVNNPNGGVFDVEVDQDAEALTLSSDDGVLGGVLIKWKAAGEGFFSNGIANDLTGIELAFASVSSSFVGTLYLISKSGGVTYGSSAFIHVSASDELQVASVGLAELSIPAGFDLGDVTEIIVSLPGDTAVDSLDFVLTEFRAVPAPASLALLGLACFTIRRRR